MNPVMAAPPSAFVAGGAPMTLIAKVEVYVIEIPEDVTRAGK